MNEDSKLGGLFEIDTDAVYPDVVVKIDKTQFSIFELKRQYEDETRQNIILNPDFQRDDVWNKKQKSELIESILMGIPLPVIYFFEREEDSKKEVVDGRQRITTLIHYMNNKFPLENLHMLKKINDKCFKDLDPKLQAKIEDYQLNVYVIQPPTPDRVKFDIFDRVNRGGTLLSQQEMRNALYPGNATKLLNELSKLDVFQDATGNTIAKIRMKDKYMILRFLGFYLLQNNKLDYIYRSDIDEFLGFVMKYLNSFKKYEDILYLKNIFIKSMTISYKIFEGEGFRFNAFEQNRRPINTPLFEVLSYFYTFIEIDTNLNTLKKDINKLKDEFDKTIYFKSSVESSNSMEYRFNAVRELGKKYAK